MDFSILGPLEVTVSGRPIPVRGGLPRALAVLLLLRRRSPAPADVIADRLWPGAPPADPANAVHRVVSHLRRALGPEGGPLLVRHAPGYALLAGDDAVDATRFERLVRAAMEAGADAARHALDDIDAALSLWRGEPLADVAHHEWAAAEVSRLEETWLQARETRLALLLTMGRPHEVVTEAQALIARYPLREQLHARLMLALYRTGRQGEALQAYATVRRTLADELGLDPGPMLQQLEHRILAQDDGLQWTPPPAGATTPAVAARAEPAQATWAAPTSLVGRQKELTELEDLLARTRLLTLTGPGGAGKTRLARELIGRRTDRDTWFVDLSVLANDGLVAPTVARAVGAPVPPGADPVQGVVDRLADARGVLVLDNCEHVIEAAGALASRLLPGCADLALVATSRRSLRVTGEVTWPVPPLALPPSGATRAASVADTAAAELFAARAAAVRPGFVIDDGNAADVAAIVQALDGLPLAIELAAAHADVLPVDAIRRRLADHFELLETDVRDVPVRQRTLRAVIDSSVDLLTGPERLFFVHLGAFAGSFDLEGAAAVTGGPPAITYRLTASLVRQSLVVPTWSGRYRLLESLRVYAAEALAADPALGGVRLRHLDHFVELMTAADEQIRTDAQEEWLIRVRESLPDLRSALRWALSGAEPERGALLAAKSTWYWTLEGMLEEASQWLTAAEAAPVSQDEVRAALLLAIGRIAAPRGELTRARTACAASVRISRRTGDDRMLGAALVTLGIAQWALGELTAAAASHDEAVERLTVVADRWNRAAALALRARTAIDAGDADVDSRIETALADARRLGEKHVLGLAISQRARRALLLGDVRAAREAAEQCLTVWRQVGYQEGEINALNLMARASIAEGQSEQAEELLRQAVRTAADIRHRGGLCESMENLAAVRHVTGRDGQARLLLEAAARERRSSAIPKPAAEAGQITDLATRVGAAIDRADGAYPAVEVVLEQLGIRP